MIETSCRHLSEQKRRGSILQSGLRQSKRAKWPLTHRSRRLLRIDSFSHRVSLISMARYHRGAACPACESHDCRRSHRRNLRERSLGWIGIRPYRCRECRARFWQFRGRIWDGTLISILSILGLFLGASVAHGFSYVRKRQFTSRK